MVFQLSRTFSNPAGSQSGQPSPGAGAQTTGPARPLQRAVQQEPVRPTQGRRSWFKPSSPESLNRGGPTPQNADQARPVGSMPNHPVPFGTNVEVWTPYYDRGAAAYVQNYGKLFTNPIGAGVVAQYRPQASYGGAAQYENGALWWTSQVIPTSIALQSLSDPASLLAILGTMNIEGVVRTTG